MSLSFNGTVPKTIIYNGTDLTKVIFNSVVVWTSSTPYTVTLAVADWNWSATTQYSHTYSNVTLTNGYITMSMSQNAGENMVEFAGGNLTASYPTNDCTRCAITYSVSGTAFTEIKINGTNVSATTGEHVHTIDCSGTNQEIKFALSNGSKAMSTLQIKSIQFYN